MATFPSTCALNGIILVISCFALRLSVGDTVQVMTVTPNPYGAGIGETMQTSIVCLLSPPDTGSQILDTIQTGRHVLRSRQDGSLSLPAGSSSVTNGNNIQANDLLTSNVQSQGVFYCEASSRGLTTRVPISIMVSYRLLQPSSGMFTITSNIGDTVQFILDIFGKPRLNNNEFTDILWEKQANETADFETLPYSGQSYQIASVSEEHAGVYYAYWRDFRHSYTGSLFRLIVRSCSKRTWDPPSCVAFCDNCYNGGICDENTGGCVCRPGFTGPNCLTACGENKFGWNCEHECGNVLRIPSCSGSVFCMPDPVGCSCMTGWMGVECTEECPEGMFGAGCTQTCHCQSGSCDRSTGKCDGGSSTIPTRWLGDNCQIPDTCPAGYYGPQCLEKCYCNNCEKTTGNCLNGQCLDRYYGTNCDMQCSNECITCDVTTGCMNSQCYYGHWGNNCEILCSENCFNCNKATGCTGCKTRFWGPNCENSCPDNCIFCDQTVGCTQCVTSFWGPSCEMICPNICLSACDRAEGCTRCVIGLHGPDCNNPCHCQYSTQCDSESGKCNYAISIGVAPCEPGYVSDSGVNWNDCQKFVSCFDGCSKTCHCRNSGNCFTDSGQCLSGQCEQNWVGATCQNGIVAVSNEKINPEQTTMVTCTVMSEPVAPTTDKVTFMDGNLDIGGEIQVVQHGIGAGNTFWNFTSNFMGPPVPNNIFCIVRFDEGTAIASFQPDYYVLPTLTTSPEVQGGSITVTTVILEWDAWNPDAGLGDTGDGPVVAYNIYDLVATTLVGTVSVTPTTPSPIAGLISNLTPNTFYRFGVRPVRQGLGGEGSATQEVFVTTLPDSSQTETPIVVKTMKTDTTKQVESGDRTPESVPGRPTNVRTVSTTTTIVNFEWNDPTGSNGNVISYHVDYRAVHALSQSDELLVGAFTNISINVGVNHDGHFTYELGDLEPGTTYEVYISAANMIGNGEQAVHSIETKSTDKSQGSSVATAGAGGVSGAIILIIIIVVVVVIIMIRKRRDIGSQHKDEGNRFCNQAFSPDLDAYEDVDLDDQEYEEVTSSKWNISWNDINLSGNILGTGNFGEVQLGKVRIKDKLINAAVKTLKRGTPESERALFKEEFDTMTRIGYHPNVVNILGSCEHEGSFFVILEYVHHGNLRRFLRKCRKEQKAQGMNAETDLSPTQLMNFALGVAKAMDHISNCGIIHRDLAARNILVGRGFTPKVADFGMSREEHIYVQASSRRVPTRWLSIESMTQRTYSTKTDVWSFGILLWEIATFGGTPYPDMETKYLSYHLTSGHRMSKPESCEDEVYQLMLQCWQEDPGVRPSFRNIVDILSDFALQDKIYMSTHFYENFKYAVISLDKDDK